MRFLLSALETPLSRRRAEKPVARAREAGHAAIETALMLPWLIFSFMGAFDVGVYNYSLVSTESAARVVAMYASSSTSVAQNPTSACAYALAELRDAPNVGSTSSCSSGGVVNVTTTYLASGADGLPAVQVSVTYLATPGLSIPGLITGSLTITRTVEMPIRS
ncbi:MAG: TadE family protein [Bryobacteraceae bacterium]|jgi:Flp pilus assembly protein TadG